jgi:hypothetical protein
MLGLGLTHYGCQDLEMVKIFVIVLTDLSQVLELTPLKWLGTQYIFWVSFKKVTA